MKKLDNWTTGELDAKRRTPMPFPGRWPTRWQVFGYENRNASLLYAGKPNPDLLHGIVRGVDARGSSLYLKEFDRGGVFREEFCGMITQNAILARYYFPFHHLKKIRHVWTGYMIRPTALIHRNKKRIVYMTETDALNLPILKEHKFWLEKSDLRLLK